MVLKVKKLQLTHRNTHLVNNLTFSVRLGETLALVGRSGSGKSLTAQAILGQFFSPEIFVSSGEIWINDQNICLLSAKERRFLLGRQIAYIPQNPQNALNPTRTIGSQLIEAGMTKESASRRAKSLLQRVDISPEYFHAIPAQLSGGMRQRVLIAMALMNNPQIIIADEPTTALDVTVQAQILELLVSIQEEFGLSLLFITHDLGVVAQVAHRAIVLDHGTLVEECSIDELFSSPQSEAGIHLVDAARFSYCGAL